MPQVNEFSWMSSFLILIFFFLSLMIYLSYILSISLNFSSKTFKKTNLSILI